MHHKLGLGEIEESLPEEEARSAERTPPALDPPAQDDVPLALEEVPKPLQEELLQILQPLQSTTEKVAVRACPTFADSQQARTRSMHFSRCRLAISKNRKACAARIGGIVP